MPEQNDLASVDVDRYLERIGHRGDRSPTLATLTALQAAHLTAVPFENLEVVAGVEVRTDTAWALDKVVQRGLGGWCFELNGAFAALLEALGFGIRRLGAAVLLGGPSTLIDHLTLEVQLDEPYLVDVGFGDSFSRPLALNRPGPQDGGTGTFEFLASPQGTTFTEHVDGVPDARYRFKRVTHAPEDFAAVSERLRTDTDLHWSQKRFSTRLLDGGPGRVTLLEDRLKIRRDGVESETPVASDQWAATYQQWFSSGSVGPS